MRDTLVQSILVSSILSELTLTLTTVCFLWHLIRMLKSRTATYHLFKVSDSRLSIISYIAGILAFNSLLFVFKSMASQQTNLHVNKLTSSTNTLGGGYTENTLISTADLLSSNLVYSGEVEIFAMVILFLANYVGVICKSTLDSRLRLDNLNFIVLLLYFNLVLIYFISSVSFIDFFILYEFLLIPSFLIVFITGYSRRAINSSIYFLI